ncbi:MAG: epoxyqueuosine reductase QueH [Candidatus Delongbacteria bacterium]|nr:epoxyqueuosine reductase QueH [Candidatus Delongbacteria bacterium]
MKKKLLLHLCCAPCVIVPAAYLSDQYDITAFWFNPNIQPMTEYFKRVDAVGDYTRQIGMPVVYCHDYDPEIFFRRTAFHEDTRCQGCYELRLRKTYHYAKQYHFDCYSTTLIQSHHQDLTFIKNMAHDLAADGLIEFVDFDFRDRWKEGVEISRRIGMYRQQYCGCIYSEFDRYRHHYLKEYVKPHENRTV